MIFARPSAPLALYGATRRVCMQASPKQVTSTVSRRQYANGVDGAKQVVSSSSKLPWILSAGALTAGGLYVFLQPHASKSVSQSIAQSGKNDSNAQKQQEQDNGGKRDWYASDHPKPVEDRHGDSVKKHSIAAEKNEYKIRTGVFSKKEFDNHIQKREADPADEFETVEKRGDGKEGK
ncbi:hypothetical protein EK21DRAFT_92643 [Setomelanomma holmii]|uniref:Uncharacterized protein n=1 Tax=Setomelanomma holmii TaxID=210430 RepID=A0A9P4H2J3_9PLEO|nr:hypothetical protein EK21DRAFT_92643 [Setomelanomma holmii]